jgi:Sec-independent protein translocase protein TatA
LGFVIFLGLLVFGPKKTLEMSQSVGRSIAQLKKAASQVHTQMETELGNPTGDIKRSDLLASIFDHRK